MSQILGFIWNTIFLEWWCNVFIKFSVPRFLIILFYFSSKGTIVFWNPRWCLSFHWNFIPPENNLAQDYTSPSPTEMETFKYLFGGQEMLSLMCPSISYVNLIVNYTMVSYQALLLVASLISSLTFRVLWSVRHR